MFRHFLRLAVSTALAAASGAALAQSDNDVGKTNMFSKRHALAIDQVRHWRNRPQTRMFGQGHPFEIDELRQGRVRAKINSLPLRARVRAMEWLHRFKFPENDVESMLIDDEGGVLYVEPVPLALGPQAADAPQAPGTSPELAAIAADAFELHSRPGAFNVVYLDFDGENVTGTAWSRATLFARPFDLDGKPSTFNAAERTAIAEIWHRVAEDFAPFDIDVTTEDPGYFGPYTGRVLITPKTQANGAAMPFNSGDGVAYVGVWGRSDYGSYYSPAFVYFDNLASQTTDIAEACAHEFGHHLGLSHDGASNAAYYAGHGSGPTSWAPIMGTSYQKNVTQWSRGEYAGANNTQDDIAVIASELGFSDDDHGDSLNAATPLRVDTDGQVSVTNPEGDPDNSYPANKGVVEMAGDLDVFSFTITKAGPVDLSVTPAWDAFYRAGKRGANLDIQASVLDANGATLALSDPITETHASLLANLPAGNYFLEVTGVGNRNYSNYASAGQYFISGRLPVGPEPNLAPGADFSYGCVALTCDFVDTSSDSDGTLLAWAWDFGDGQSGSIENPRHTYVSAGSYEVTLTVTDDEGATASRSHGLTVASGSLLGANLVVNSGAEVDWKGWSGDAGTQITRPKRPHSGNRSIRVVAAPGTGAAVKLLTPVPANAKLRLTGWLYATGTDRVEVYLRRRQNGAWRSQYMTEMTLPRRKWTKFDVTRYVAGAKLRGGNIYFSFPHGTQRTFIDDVEAIFQ